MNLGEALEAIYRGIHDDIVDGVATGGSATTIIDTTLEDKHPQNKFKNWVAFISRTTDGLTPQNKYSKIRYHFATLPNIPPPASPYPSLPIAAG